MVRHLVCRTVLLLRLAVVCAVVDRQRVAVVVAPVVVGLPTGASGSSAFVDADVGPL